MKPEVYRLTDDLWLDARRALWLGSSRTLVVSDLHLGYAWAHRHDGQLLPFGPAGEMEGRLSELQNDYQPARVVLLGDIVHRSVPVPALRKQLGAILEELMRTSQVTIIGGNHDRRLELLLTLSGSGYEFCTHRLDQRCLLLHGDQKKGKAPVLPEKQEWDRVVIGHEHPAVRLGDGVTSSVRFPCFMVSQDVIVLPAFSMFAAGSEVGGQEWMSPWARAARFTHVVAIAGKRLLPLPWKCV